MVAYNGYISNGTATNTFTLPLTASVGDTFRVIAGTHGWIIAQNVGQSIVLGTSTTTSGTGGSLASTAAGDGIEIVCIVADTLFQIPVAPQGNIQVV
jgi:hypothetical protein